MDNLIDRVENLHNQASDTNFVWFPFLFLKLQPDQVLTPKHIAMMTVCFSSYFNAVYVLKRYFFSDITDASDLLLSQAYFALGFFIWFNLVTRTFWNRRALRLKTKKSR